MRVIAGDLRSRKIKRVEDVSTRETKDRVKESIFNMIGPYHQMNHVLDLFAGSGSLGIESCSRGANKVDFVDQSFKAVKVIKENIQALEIEDACDVFQGDAFTYLDQAKKSYDLIFLDPPYNSTLIDEYLEKIAQKKLLTEDGLIVVLSDQHTSIKETSKLVISKQKRITRTNVIFLKWRN